MKTRLALARSVLHRPDLLLFDEPTSGLDPESSHAVLGLIREMSIGGTTIVLCTHLLSEAEGLADRIVVLQEGATLVDGEPEELMRRYWPRTSVVIEADDAAALAGLAGHPGVIAFERLGAGAVRAEVGTEDDIGELVAHLARQQARIRRVEPFRPSLEDLYFAVRRSGRANRIGEVAS